MPEVQITIGERSFAVACQDGEEQFLHTAAAMLDTEARALSDQIGRMPEARMLLMAGLMLADKTAAMEDRVNEAEGRANALQAELESAGSAPAERVEVPVVPTEVHDILGELAARAEALASEIEEKASA